MKYSIRSDMMEKMTTKAPWLVRYVFFYRIWQVLSRFLLPFEYLGLLVAPAVVLSIPFQIFHYHHYSPYAFWIMAGLMATLILFILIMASFTWLRLFRRNVIYVDAIVLFVGLVFAASVIIWIFPPK